MDHRCREHHSLAPKHHDQVPQVLGVEVKPWSSVRLSGAPMAESIPQGNVANADSRPESSIVKSVIFADTAH